MAILASVLAYFTSFQRGSRLIDGGDCLDMATRLFGVTTGLVALAGGGQHVNTTPLALGLNRVDTCASASDSVMLPPAIPGSCITVYNNTAATLAVFGQGANMGGLAAGDTIAANNSNTQQPTATGVTQATAVQATYTCYVAGQWKQAISA